MSLNIYEDNRAGLMPQIQALIAPPASEKAADKKPADQHPYFKRPGRGHNHDLCDCCGEGGDLICCDKCPSSFHLQCHNPPLEESHIPLGEWLCHKCKYSTSKGKENDYSKPKNCMDVLIEAAKLVNPKLFELPYELTQPFDFPGTDKDLLPYIRSHQPHQRRPYSLSIAPSFRPSTTASHPSNASAATSASAGGTSSGTLQPLGVRCYECRKSCHSSLLLKCDYCSLHWHLDCLRPPLAAPPGVRWMCPNHVEHTLDAKLLTSASATERTRIWNAFKAPVDQDAIKLAFFRKIQRRNPPFRVRVRHNRRKKACIIPQMIKNHYRQPVPLLPSLRDAIRAETVRSRLNDIENYFQNYCDISNDVTDTTCSHTNDTEIELKQLNELTKKIDNDITNIGKDIIDDISNDVIKITQEIQQNDDESDDTVNLNRLTNAKNNYKTSTNGQVVINSDLIEDLQSCNAVWKLDRESEAFLTEVLLENERRQRKLQQDEQKREMAPKIGFDVKYEGKEEVLDTDMEKGLNYFNSLEAVEANYLQLRQLDIHLLRVLALQRIQQLISSPSSNMPLPSQLLTAEDIERISKAFNGGVYNDVSQVPLPHHYPNNMTPEQTRQHKLQQERLQQQQQYSRRGHVGSVKGSCVRARAMLCPVISKYFYNVRTQDVDAMDVRHDASFMGYRPTVSARFPEATAMRFCCITIGRGVANDLQLDRYGHCNFISAKHAVIFYDENTKHYELLNYSLFGTSVNNVRYCNDSTIAGLATTTYCTQQQQPMDSSDDQSATLSSSDQQGIAATTTTTVLLNKGCCMGSQSSMMEKQIVRDIIDKRRKMGGAAGTGMMGNQSAARKIMVNDCKMAAMDLADRMECSCAGNPAISNNIPDITATGPNTAPYGGADSPILGGLGSAGWEGSAVLSHGALVRFGCIAFVFSIVDCATV